MKKLLLFVFAAVVASVVRADNDEVIQTVSESDTVIADSGKVEGKRFTWKKALEKADPTIKFGGYIIGQYSVNDETYNEKHSNFNLRLVRLYLNGYCFQDFYYRLQMEVNGQPGVDKGPRIVDAFVEWQHWDEFRVKIGQFKRAFGFENPMAPLAIGVGNYSLATRNFLFNDRCGEHSVGGRDLGIQAQGDFLPGKDGHKWLHYQIGVYNGQGINHSDKNHHKDVIGTVWISPVKNFRIGAFGWNGKYTNENFSDDGKQQRSVKRVRWGVGIDYESNWVARAEYYSSVGGSVKDVSVADRSDAWYALVGAPICKGLKLYGRWDCYRSAKTWNSLQQDFGATASYWLGKHFLLQMNYTFTDNRNAKFKAKKDRFYNTVDFQVAARFSLDDFKKKSKTN